MSENNEISIHEVRIYNVLQSNQTQWITNKQIATEAKVSGRTARLHTLRLVKLGILDQAEVFPAHRYRISEKASKRNVAYVQRLEKAKEVFGDMSS